VSEEQGGRKDASGPGGIAGPGGVTRGPLNRRRVLLWTAIAVLFVIAAVVAPGYYAMSPGFAARYSNLTDAHRTWSGSTHADVWCQSCHVPPAITDQAAHSARMLGEFYVSLVSRGRMLDVFKPPTNAACRRCHTALVTASPKGDLIIPHRAHVDILKMECVTCHGYVVHEKNLKGTHTPPMAACLTCHDGDQAKSACVTCHTAKAAPESHAAADWLVVHPKRETAECATCHGWTADWCADCHARRPPSHTAEWRDAHPIAVTVRRNCEACHTADSCIRCHGEVPGLNLDPAVKLVE